MTPHPKLTAVVLLALALVGCEEKTKWVDLGTVTNGNGFTVTFDETNTVIDNPYVTMDVLMAATNPTSYSSTEERVVRISNTITIQRSNDVWWIRFK